MIAVRLEGRLGNQLFQYAFAYAAAKQLNTKFYLDKSVDFPLVDQYFMIENDFCNPLDQHIFSISGYRNIFSHYSRWSFYYLLRHALFLKKEIFSDNEAPDAQLNKIRNNCIFIGHFQSEKYFSSRRDDIKRLFSIKDGYKKKFESIFRTLPRAAKYVTVHIRRGDYTALNLTLKTAYYHDAIKKIHTEDNYYILISDDINFVKAEFAYLCNKYVSENEEIIDFQFLTRADICIVSNSSFSWWGAWLNNKAGKLVIAPELWLGQPPGREYPAGIIQPDWLLLHNE